MRTTRHSRTTRLMKLAAGLLIAALLVATGWAVEKVYQTVAGNFVLLEEGTVLELKSEPVKLPDGGARVSTWSVDTRVVTSLPEDAPPGAVEKARQDHEEMKQLIAQGKYEFIDTFEGPSGQTQYVYSFTLPDGTKFGSNFSIPLEDVASWDDYRQKEVEHYRRKMAEEQAASPLTEEKAAQDHEEMKQLIAQGKYEFIDTFEGPSGQTQYVYSFTLADGTKLGSNFSIPLENVASWDDYVQKRREQEGQRQE